MSLFSSNKRKGTAEGIADFDGLSFRRAPAGYFAPTGIQKIRTGCPAHNCGGRCLLIAHVENGRITRLDTDDRPDSLESPQLRACPRGRAYLRRQYHPDRLLHPLKRTGARGEGQFQQISWDEALETVAAQFERVKAAYGNEALEVATTVKLARALWIIPVSLLSAFLFKNKGKKISIPWFILFFILAMLANSYLPGISTVAPAITAISKSALVVTLFLIGAGLSVEKIKSVGWKPLILGIILWITVSILSLLVIMHY